MCVCVGLSVVRMLYLIFLPQVLLHLVHAFSVSQEHIRLDQVGNYLDLCCGDTLSILVWSKLQSNGCCIVFSP